MAVLLAAAGVAHADPDEPETRPVENLAMADQEFGAKAGVQIDAIGLAAGGFRAGGEYLYRVSPSTWFDGEASFAFGGGGIVCHLARDQSESCSPGGLGGVGFQLDTGARWILLVPKKRSEPMAYAKAGIGVHINSFPSDGVFGLGVVGWAGGGGRYRIGKNVSLLSELTFAVGPALYNKGIGVEGTMQVVAELGIELGL